MSGLKFRLPVLQRDKTAPFHVFVDVAVISTKPLKVREYELFCLKLLQDKAIGVLGICFQNRRQFKLKMSIRHHNLVPSKDFVDFLTRKYRFEVQVFNYSSGLKWRNLQKGLWYRADILSLSSRRFWKQIPKVVWIMELFNFFSWGSRRDFLGNKWGIYREPEEVSLCW